jgi:uncharacterized protein (TIGR00251 family)
VLKPTASGIEIDIRVIPRAGRTQLAGERDGRLLVRLAAPPVEGAANGALIEFLAGILDVPRRAVRIVAGERGRQKRVAVDGVDAAEARARLARSRSAG